MTRYQSAIAAGCLVLLVLIVSLLQPRLPVDDPSWRTDYDVQFGKHAKHYFGAGTDWRWFRAQGITESGLRPQARSGRGARGIMQLMPSTYAEIWKDSILVPDIDEPRWNVASGIAYDRYLYDRWRRRLPRSERMNFTLAGYNAGYSGVLKAVERARGAGAAGDDWAQVSGYAPDETRNYVNRITALMAEGG